MSSRSHSRSAIKPTWVASGLAVALSVGLGLPRVAPAIAQVPEARVVSSLRPQEVAPRIYEALPELPLQNQYERRGGDVDADNTLMLRLVQYHLYVKGRPAFYRLDWKLTLADYLGANEYMNPATYPGADSLEVNPLEDDRAAVEGLTRSQRDELVQTLVSLFSPAAANPEQSSPASSPAGRSGQSPSRPASPPTPRPGDAELLRL